MDAPPNTHPQSARAHPPPRSLLEPIKAKYPWISYADLWTLAGAVAIEAMGGECRGGVGGGDGVTQRTDRTVMRRSPSAAPACAHPPTPPPGPEIKWQPGRVDKPDASACTPDGRLPDASLGAAHLRDIFGRMGFNDQ